MHLPGGVSAPNCGYTKMKQPANHQEINKSLKHFPSVVALGGWRLKCLLKPQSNFASEVFFLHSVASSQSNWGWRWCNIIHSYSIKYVNSMHLKVYSSRIVVHHCQKDKGLSWRCVRCSYVQFRYDCVTQCSLEAFVRCNGRQIQSK